MSLVKWYRLRCNGCRRLSPTDAYPSAREARKQARRLGWRRVPGSARSGADLCGSCAIGREDAR
jgi:hypothetical protein